MDSMKEMIEQRAYALYLRRGKIPGFHEEDWQQAERELLSEIEARKKSAAAQVVAAAMPSRQPAAAKPAETARIKPKEITPIKPAAKTPKKKK